jgi:hypothetical protein
MFAKKKGGWSSVPDPRQKRTTKEPRKTVKFLTRPEPGPPLGSAVAGAAADAGAAGESVPKGRPKVDQGKERFMRSLKVYTMVFMMVGVSFAGRNAVV